MDSRRKNKNLTLTKSEYEIFCLIKAGMLGSCTHLMNEKERDELVKTGGVKGEKFPYALTFSSAKSDQIFQQVQIGQVLDLYCEKKLVGQIKVESKFKNDKRLNNIFSSNTCSLEGLGEICIGGEFELFESKIEQSKQEFLHLKKTLNARSITAIVSSFDPLHRGHERIFRWTIDKADLVVVFLIESYEENGFDFELKHKFVQSFIQQYIPKERVFVFPLKDIAIFHAHLNPKLEGIIAKSLNCTKIVVGQNHTGLGMFFDNNIPKTMLDEFAKDYGIEVVVLPEFVFCEKCKVAVSIKSCPHGSHHHIKFNSASLKSLLRLGIIPPPVFMRREISFIILTHLFSNRFKHMQKLYNDLFATQGIIEERKDEEFYAQLLKLYQITYMV